MIGSLKMKQFVWHSLKALSQMLRKAMVGIAVVMAARMIWARGVFGVGDCGSTGFWLDLIMASTSRASMAMAPGTREMNVNPAR